MLFLEKMCKKSKQVITDNDYCEELVQDDDDDWFESSDPFEQISFVARYQLNLVLSQLGGGIIEEEDWSLLCWHQMIEISEFAYNLLRTEQSYEAMFDVLFLKIVEKQMELHCE